MANFVLRDVETTLYEANKAHGLYHSNDKKLRKYYKHSDEVLNVETLYEEMVPKSWGPGLYYTTCGMILRQHKKSHRDEEEWLEDLRICPITFFPYEVVKATEEIVGEGINLPVRHIEELKALAIISHGNGEIEVKDIVIDYEMFSSITNIKKELSRISRNHGWIEIPKSSDVLVMIQRKNEQIAQNNCKDIAGVTYLGIHPGPENDRVAPGHEKYYYVGGGITLDKRNKEVNNMRCITGKIEKLDTKLVKAEYTVIPQEFKDNIFKFNEEGLCALLIGTYAGFYFKPRLKNIHVKSPILGIFGLSGCGKSATLENVLMPLHGLDGSETLMAKSTKEFALIKSMSSHNIIPTILSEYKPDQLTKVEIDLINHIINNAYDGASVARGRPTQERNNYYNLMSPLVVCGEGYDPDKSKLERMIIVQMNADEIEPHPFWYLEDHPQILTSIGKMMLMRAMGITDKALSDSFKANLKYLEGHKLSPRCEANILHSLLGLDLFLEVIGMTEKGDGLKKAAVRRYLTDTLSTKGGVTNAVEEILEDISQMAQDKIIPENTWEVKNGMLNLCLGSIFPIYAKYLRDQGRPIRLSKMSFEKQAQGFRTISKARRYVRGNDNARSVLEIEQQWLERISNQKGIDFSGFGINSKIPYEELERSGIKNA